MSAGTADNIWDAIEALREDGEEFTLVVRRPAKGAPRAYHMSTYVSAYSQNSVEDMLHELNKSTVTVLEGYREKLPKHD